MAFTIASIASRLISVSSEHHRVSRACRSISNGSQRGTAADWKNALKLYYSTDLSPRVAAAVARHLKSPVEFVRASPRGPRYQEAFRRIPDSADEMLGFPKARRALSRTGAFDKKN